MEELSSPQDATCALIRGVLDISASIRYVAVYRNGVLTREQRAGIALASASESDMYEELLVNPTILTLLKQRGEIDCGGLAYVIIAYGHFFQLVRRLEGGHISICIDLEEDPVRIERRVAVILEENDEVHHR